MQLSQIKATGRVSYVSLAGQDERPRQRIKKGALPHLLQHTAGLLQGPCRSLNRAAPKADAKAGARYRSVGVGTLTGSVVRKSEQGEPFFTSLKLTLFQLAIR